MAEKPDINQEILKTLKSINNKLEEDLSDYCNANQAIALISLTKQQQLKYLLDHGFLFRYPRGNGFRYRRSECRKVAQKIDLGEIVIPPNL